jgi:influenza virus NS1A-binding protein
LEVLCYESNVPSHFILIFSPSGRYQAGVCAYRGEIWVIGGCESWGVLNTVEIYNLKTETWRPGPPISVARRGCGVTEFMGKLWVIGGTDGPNSLFSSEFFDPDDRKWHEGPNLTVPRGNVAAVSIGDRLYAVGGFTGKCFLKAWTNAFQAQIIPYEIWLICICFYLAVCIVHSK